MYVLHKRDVVWYYVSDVYTIENVMKCLHLPP